MEIHGTGNQSRCFTWIDDVVKGIKLAGDLDEGIDGSNLTGRSFNLGSTIETSILELVNLCRDVSGVNIEPIYVDSNPGDTSRRLPDVNESEQALGWSAEVSLKDGIERTWAWIKNNSS